MFLEPELLTAAPFFREEQERARKDDGYGDAPGSGAPMDALRSQALRYRFWHAKAKRERAWWEPTSEEVLRVRERYRQ